jgi:hypothetical protein
MTSGCETGKTTIIYYKIFDSLEIHSEGTEYCGFGQSWIFATPSDAIISG